jgi:ABC-type transport system substrate-binding protein
VSADTALLQIDGGQLDVLATELPPAGYQAIRDDPARSDRLVEATVDNCLYLTLNDVETSGLFKSVEARRAIHQAIDKERILQQMQGRGEVATGFWSPKSAYYDEDFPVVEYDAAAAKQTLSGLGLAGTEVEVYAPSDGSSFPLDQFGPAIEQDLAAAGLRPKLQTLEFSAWLGKTMTRGAVVPNGWAMDIPHGSFVIDSAFTQATKEAADADDTCCNFSHWASARVDELNKAGVTTTDKQEEIDAYREIMRIAIGEQQLWVPVIWPKRSFYSSARVQGMEVTPNAASILLSRLSLTA